ncbi:MAG TPA: GNAT family N-acetyltransferase [Dokdonella sp.]
MARAAELLIRLARGDDDAFVLGLAERFVAFELPPWRRRGECASAIRADLAQRLRDQPPGTHVFVAEDAAGERVGFVHLETLRDFFTGAQNCHVCALAAARDGEGVGSALLAFAERWAREQRCRHVTLGVFPGNERARALYERRGYGTDLLRLVKRVR